MAPLYLGPPSLFQVILWPIAGFSFPISDSHFLHKALNPAYPLLSLAPSSKSPPSACSREFSCGGNRWSGILKTWPYPLYLVLRNEWNHYLCSCNSSWSTSCFPILCIPSSQTGSHISCLNTFFFLLNIEQFLSFLYNFIGFTTWSNDS